MKRSHVTTKEKNVKFLKLLSIALSNDYMLLRQDYHADLQTKMKNIDFFISSPFVHMANSHKEQGNYNICVC